MYFEFWGIWQKLINFGMGLCFNIAPRQERYLIYKKEGRLYDVSIHAPKRERPQKYKQQAIKQYIQLHPN